MPAVVVIAPGTNYRHIPAYMPKRPAHVRFVREASIRGSEAKTCVDIGHELTTLIGMPTAKAFIWSKTSANCSSHSS